MSATNVKERSTIADVMSQFGHEGVSVPDLNDTIRQVESIQSARFAFHPWCPIPNFGSDGFRFNVQYAVLDRLVPIFLPAFPYPKIIARSAGMFALIGATLTEAVPSTGSQSKVETLLQMPSVSIAELRMAYGDKGMVELASLLAHDPQELAKSLILFEAVMGVAQSADASDSKRRPPDLVLEDFPMWLETDAPRALRAGLRKVVVRGNEYKLTSAQIPKGEQLIEEIKNSIALAESAALNPSDGILPRTKELLNITANNGQGGKTHLDRLDNFLLEQYPSFRMDTDVERAQKAMQSALEAGHHGDDEFKTGIMAILQQQQKTLDLLAGKVVEPKEPKESKARTGATRGGASSPE